MLLRPIYAATPENPRFSLNDPAAIEAFLGGSPSSSGVRVTRETALTHAPWWRGVNLLANDAAKLPLRPLRVKGKGKEPFVDHPSYKLLRRKPNEFMTAFQFKRLLTAHAVNQGNGYALIDRKGSGIPVELLPLDPDSVTPARENGKLLYVVQVGADKRRIPADNMLHVKGFGYDGLMGYSVYVKAAETIGVGLAQRKFGSVFFKNNARPNVAVELPGALDEKQAQALRKGWADIHEGLDNNHRLAILQRGAKLTQFSIPAKEAQLIEAMSFNRTDVALYLGVPPHKLGDSSRTSYNSLEQENQDYLDTGLDPWLIAFEEECCDKLLTEEEKDNEEVEIEFDRKKLVRANLNDRSNYYVKATGGKAWMDAGEVREEEGLDPDDWDDPADAEPDPADVPPAPPGVPPVAPPQPPAPPAPPKKAESSAELRSAVAAVLTEAVGRMVRRVGLHADRAAADHRRYGEWLSSWASEHQEVVAAALAPSKAMIAAVGGDEFSPAAWLLLRLGQEYGDLADRATLKTLAEECRRLSADLETRLPAEAVAVYLGE